MVVRNNYEEVTDSYVTSYLSIYLQSPDVREPIAHCINSDTYTLYNTECLYFLMPVIIVVHVIIVI